MVEQTNGSWRRTPGRGRDMRRWIALIIIPVVALAGYGSSAVYNSALDRSIEEGGLTADFALWEPTPGAVRGALMSIPSERERKAKFIPMFESRYRKHDPPMAVGLRFMPGNRIKLMCPARMEPWNMDRLAIATWHEVQDEFGHPFDIDLYITFIGAPPEKVGELRPMPVNPSFAVTRYHNPEKPPEPEDARYHPMLLFTDPLKTNYRQFLAQYGR